MVTKYVGKQGWGGIAIEAVEGTPLDPQVFLPYEDLDGSDDLTTVTPKEHRGSMDDTFSIIRTAAENKITLKMDMFPEMGLEHLLAGAFSTPTYIAEGTTAYKYTFAQSNVSPTFTIHEGLASEGAILPKVYSNAVLDSFKFSVKEKEQAKLDVGFVSKPVSIDTVDATPTYSAQQPVPFVFPELKFKWNDYGTGVTQDTMIQGVDFEINRAVQTEITANNSLSPSIYAQTGFKLSGKFSRIFQGLTEYKKYLGSASATTFLSTQVYKNAEIELVGKPIPGTTPSTTPYSFKLEIPRILITKNGVKYSGDNIIKEEYDWLAMKDNALGYTARATTVSKLAPASLGIS